MNEFYEIKKTILMTIDETNENKTFGYTKSRDKVLYNINSLSRHIDIIEYQYKLSKSKEGLTSLFPLGQYIVIIKIKKDKSDMEMFFFDSTIDCPEINFVFKDYFSSNIIYHFNRIKNMLEVNFNEKYGKVVLIDFRRAY